MECNDRLEWLMAQPFDEDAFASRDRSHETHNRFSDAQLVALVHYCKETRMTSAQIGARIGKSAASVRNMLHVLGLGSNGKPGQRVGCCDYRKVADGFALEDKVAGKLKRLGWDVRKSPASRGLFDMVAVGGGRYVSIQCKLRGIALKSRDWNEMVERAGYPDLAMLACMGIDGKRKRPEFYWLKESVKPGRNSGDDKWSHARRVEFLPNCQIRMVTV